MRKLFIILFGFLICCADAMAGTAIKPGDTPPAYIGRTLSGESVDLPSLHGDVVVISFWATWCHYCIQELPVWAGMQTVAAKHGLHMQVVAVDYKEPARTFYRVTHILQPRLPDLILTSDPDGEIGNLYGVNGIPMLVMLNNNGKVAYVHFGYDKEEFNTILKELNMLLNESMTKKDSKEKQSS
jgi:thiol-disulfide isomerase/thioredoxin